MIRDGTTLEALWSPENAYILDDISHVIKVAILADSFQMFLEHVATRDPFSTIERCI
jgi:hypothetical protein